MRRLLIACSSLLAMSCGDTHVNPDTVALVVTNDSTGVQRVNRCHYIPVLLGSQVKARYLIEDDLRVTVTLTRDELDLLFEDAGTRVTSLTLPSQQFAEEAREVVASAPDGFTVELVSPCEPREF